MPKFSIILPTRNRAHLFQYALQCALTQTFDDYEIIVSDNDSSDNTQQIIQSNRSPRIRSFRTPETYSMPDSWEFALSKASGEWVTFLTDDSAISAHLLERVNEAIVHYPEMRVISWSHLSSYFHETWDEKSRRNTLVHHPYDGGERVLSSRTLLKKLYGLLPDYTAPVALNSATRRDLIEEVKRRAGRFFLPPCPDISSCTAVSAMTDSYLYIDLPLGLNGLGKESIGMSQAASRGEAAKTFEREFDKDRLFQLVPLTTPVVVNYMAESFLRVKRALPELLRDFDLPWGLYYYYCLLHLRILQAAGVDITEELHTFFAVLKRQPLSLRISFYYSAMASRIQQLHWISRLRNRLRKIINQSKILSTIESRWRKRPEFGGKVSGTSAGFSNIFEAMKYLDHQVFGHA